MDPPGACRTRPAASPASSWWPTSTPKRCRRTRPRPSTPRWTRRWPSNRPAARHDPRLRDDQQYQVTVQRGGDTTVLRRDRPAPAARSRRARRATSRSAPSQAAKRSPWRATATRTGRPSPTSPSNAPSPAGSLTSSTASVSLRISSPCSPSTDTTSGGPSTVRRTRSETSSLASRRACCTTRTRSRARPSRCSSGVTSVSSSTRPRLPGQHRRTFRVGGQQAHRVLTLEQLDAAGHHRAVGRRSSRPPSRPGSPAGCRGRAAGRRPPAPPAARARRVGAEVVGRARPPSRSPRRATRSRKGSSRAASGGGDGERRERQAHPQAACLADGQRRRHDVAHLVHGRDQVVVGRAAWPRRASR